MTTTLTEAHEIIRRLLDLRDEMTPHILNCLRARGVTVHDGVEVDFDLDPLGLIDPVHLITDSWDIHVVLIDLGGHERMYDVKVKDVFAAMDGRG